MIVGGSFETLSELERYGRSRGHFDAYSVDKFRLRDGKIVEERIYADTAPMRAAQRGEKIEPLLRLAI